MQIGELISGIDLIIPELYKHKITKFHSARWLYWRLRAFRKWEFAKFCEYLNECVNIPMMVIPTPGQGSPHILLDTKIENGITLYRLNPKEKIKRDGLLKTQNDFPLKRDKIIGYHPKEKPALRYARDLSIGLICTIFGGVVVAIIMLMYAPQVEPATM